MRIRYIDNETYYVKDVSQAIPPEIQMKGNHA